MAESSNKHVDRFTAEHLMPGETVRDWVKARRDGDAIEGVLIATTARLVYYRSGFLSEKIEAWTIERISSVECKVKLVFTDLVVYTSGDRIKVEIWSEKSLARAFVSLLQLAINQPAGAPPQSPTPSASAPPSDDPMAMLTKLGALRDAGVLTEEEFIAKKTEILARI